MKELLCYVVLHNQQKSRIDNYSKIDFDNLIKFYYTRYNEILVIICYFNPFMPTGAFNSCCPRDCVSRHNGIEIN